MTTKLTHRTETGTEYSLTIDQDSIQVKRYSRGSISGGSGTECGHTVSGNEAMLQVLNLLALRSLSDLADKVLQFNDQEWNELHSTIQQNQTSSYLFD